MSTRQLVKLITTHVTFELGCDTINQWTQIYAYSEPVYNDDVKNLIRMGIPHERRPEIWRWIVQEKTRLIQ